MRTTKKVALIAVFASLHAVLFLPEGLPWRSYVIYLMPIEGIVLGPVAGFFSALLGSTVARLIKPSELWMFGIVAEPLGVLGAGLLAKMRWKELTLIYGVMLAAFFLHPYGTMLPLWTVLDLIVGFVLIYPTSRMAKALWGNKTRRFPVALLLVAFVSTVADSMTRVFLLVPAGLYQFFGFDFDALSGIFVLGAVGSYIEDLTVAAATLLAGVPLLLSLRKILRLEKPLTWAVLAVPFASILRQVRSQESNS
jgi:hypothetical protein